MKISLCAANMGKKVDNIDDFLSRVEDIVRSQEKNGAKLIVFPEYFSMLCLDFAPKHIKITEEIPWLSVIKSKIVPYTLSLAAKYGVAILLGTIPVARGGRYRNRALTFFPDGTTEFQDKMNLTPSEEDHKGWLLETGDKLNTFNYEDIEFGVVICHDTVSLGEEIKFEDKLVDALIVISMTETESHVDGHKFIFNNSKRISKDLRIPVLAVGAIGTQHLPERVEDNVGGAAFYDKGKTIKEIPPKSTIGNIDTLSLIVDI